MATKKLSLTTAHHLGGDDRSGWADTAALLKRAQLKDKVRHGLWLWDKYPSNRFGWVTTRGRFLGVGFHAKSALRKGERIMRIEVPFKGSGQDLWNEAELTISKGPQLKAVA